MNRLSRRLRPLLMGVVALLLTAGLALAARPVGLGSGRSTGTEASGKTVPTVVTDQTTDADSASEAEEDATTDESVETAKTSEKDQTTDATSDSADHCLVDPTTATAEALAALNHGAVVCWAAHQVTPAGYANHGAFVSEWARKNDGANPRAKGGAHAAAKAGKQARPTTTTTP
ncbi:MAG: hypothetical protein HYX54_07685 [Chloroflexi bacterium]|nr:hypothetical protein [Chloroflexota bacterium]